MSLRVSQDAISTSALSQPGGADPTAAVSKGRRNRSPEAVRVGRDRVNLSSLSERIAEAGRESDAERAGRVQRLAGLYADGQYHASALNVSGAMIDEAVGRSF